MAAAAVAAANRQLHLSIISSEVRAIPGQAATDSKLLHVYCVLEER